MKKAIDFVFYVGLCFSLVVAGAMLAYQYAGLARPTASDQQFACELVVAAIAGIVTQRIYATIVAVAPALAALATNAQAHWRLFVDLVGVYAKMPKRRQDEIAAMLRSPMTDMEAGIIRLAISEVPK